MNSPASDSTAPPGTPGKRKWFPVRIRRRWWILIGCLILLIVGMRALLPSVIERGTAFASRYYLGLPARIDNVDFALVKGIVVLEGVSIGASPDAVTPMNAAWHPPEIDPATALLHFDRISLRLSWRDLFKKTVRLTEVAIEAPSIRVVREEDGQIDPLRHAKPLASPSKSTADSGKSKSEPWGVEVHQFALRYPNVVIAGAASDRKLLEFSLESFELDDVSARAGDVSLGGLGIHGPVLRVRRDLVMATASAAEADTVSPSAASGVANPAGAMASPAAGYRIKKIDIDRAKFTWVTEEGPLDVMLTLKASNITADQGQSFPIELAMQIADGSIDLSGNVGLLPPSYTGKFRWNGLPFPPLLLASLPKLAAWLRSANSSGDLKIDADLAGAHGRPSLRFSGRSTIETLAIADPGDKEFSLGWNQLEAVMNDVVVPIPETGKTLPTTRADFALIRLVEPKIRYTHPSPALNALLGISTSPAATPPPPAASSGGSPPVDVTVASLELAGGDVEVHDTTVTPTATSTVRDLFVTAHDVHFPDPSASTVSLHATLPVASLLTVDGNLQPGNVGDFTISLQKLDLPTFNSYAMSSGVSLDAGMASVQMKLKTQGVRMQIDNDLVLQKLGISLRDPSSFNREFGMPIDLVIALMSDPAGDIRLKIPILVDEKGTSVSKHEVIASALKAALLGAVSTPLKLLGATFGKSTGPAGGGLAIAPIKSLPGSADLAPDAPARMDGLVKLLTQRPTMGLVLRGRTSAEDQPFVAEQLLIERLKAGQGLPEVKDAGFLARHRISQILSKRGKGEKVPLSPKDQALLNQYLAAAGNLEDRLTALARSRAEKARDMLVAKGVATKRLTVGDREAAGESGVVIAFRSQPAVPGKL